MPRVLQGDVRQKILQAAEERFWRYGFKKTTIDEIAADAEVGKGTVYLYFDSKEDIALAILAKFKEECLEAVEVIARDPRLSPVDKLKAVLTHGIIEVHRRIERTPATMELVLVVRPHIRARLRPYLEHETALIAEVLEEGNRMGIFEVPDTIEAAQSLKQIVAGFWPPYPIVTPTEAIPEAIGQIVDLIVRGLGKRTRHDD
jgi:AcrR family transcriptional regulator